MTTQHSPGLFRRLAHGSLVKQILAGLILGILLAWISKPAAEAVGLLGTLFVGALKAVAPILVLMLVMASIANHQHGQKTNIRPILFLYLLGTFSAALAAVIFSFAFPSTLHLSSSADDISPPSGIVEVMRGLVMSMVSNPIDALLHLQEPVHAFPGNDFLQQPSFLFLYHNIHIHKGKSQPLGQQ